MGAIGWTGFYSVGGPFRISADFADREGKQTVRIIDNEWHVRTGHWDVRTEGELVKVYSGPKKIDLVLRTVPPNNFHVERLNMVMSGYKISTDGAAFKVVTPNGSLRHFEGARIENARSLFDIDGEEVIFGIGRNPRYD
jgi:hypothetical protein